jgi:putative cell wall-binding protein
VFATVGTGQLCRAHAAIDDQLIPGIPITDTFRGSLAVVGDRSDCMRIFLLAGESVSFNLAFPPGNNLNLYLYPPHALTYATTTVDDAPGTSNPEQITYTAPADGWYYLRIYSASGDCPYELTVARHWIGPQAPDVPERVWGPDRYTTAVELAKGNFPGWQNCDHVIIASGEDRAAADPLAASGLTWVYGAPILLVRSDEVPSAVMNAIAGMAAANGGVTVHVVGGPVSIPDDRLIEIQARVPTAATERVLPAGNRYELAASIARRMDAERPSGHLIPATTSDQRVLIANGADPDKFFDALALSPIAAKTGFPIVLVTRDSIPRESAQVLNDLGLHYRIIAGGPATISEAVVNELGAGYHPTQRWWGADRYATARAIAKEAKDQTPPWLQPHNVGVAARLPDALTGGAFMGLRAGPILVTGGDALSSEPRSFLENNTTQIGECCVIGGPVSITDATKTEIRSSLVP